MKKFLIAVAVFAGVALTTTDASAQYFYPPPVVVVRPPVYVPSVVIVQPGYYNRPYNPYWNARPYGYGGWNNPFLYGNPYYGGGVFFRIR